jgi:hypothetical protein
MIHVMIVHAADPSASPAQDADVACPMCDYNLRGLVDPRCPECGYQFDWPTLLAARADAHPFLYEHHPERSRRSFWVTVLETLQPGTFWRSLQAAHRIVPPRLARYVIAGFALLTVPLLLSGVVGHSFLNVPTPPIRDAAWVAWTFAAWVAATYGVLQIFQASMRKAKIHSLHVVRVLSYSCDFVTWLGVALLILLVLPCLDAFITHGALGSGLWVSLSNLNWQENAFIAFLGCILLFAWRLARGYQLYLRFDHPIATVVSSQIIVALAFLVIVVNWATMR